MKIHRWLSGNWYGRDELALGGTQVRCHCTTNPIWTALGSEPDRHDKDPAMTRYSDRHRVYGLVVCDAVYHGVR